MTHEMLYMVNSCPKPSKSNEQFFAVIKICVFGICCNSHQYKKLGFFRSPRDQYQQRIYGVHFLQMCNLRIWNNTVEQSI